jgi:hypothetical protein
MCTEIEHQTPTENDEKRWRHSGEFGEVAAWPRRSRRVQKMRRDKYATLWDIAYCSRSVAKYTTPSP